jgi:hypothetical protein
LNVSTVIITYYFECKSKYHVATFTANTPYSALFSSGD